MPTLTNKATGEFIFDGSTIVSTSNTVNFNQTTNPLVMIKSVTPTSGVAGSTVTFTLTLNSTSQLANVKIIDILNGFTYVAGSVKINGAPQASWGTPADGTWVINVLAANIGIPVTFDAKVN